MMVYGRMEDLADIYPNKSRDELLALAGEETMQTTPTLNREAPLARFLANSGVINPFATFLASNFRNFYNHFSLARSTAACRVRKPRCTQSRNCLCKP